MFPGGFSQQCCKFRKRFFRQVDVRMRIVLMSIKTCRNDDELRPVAVDRGQNFVGEGIEVLLLAAPRAHGDVQRETVSSAAALFRSCTCPGVEWILMRADIVN